MDLEKIDNKKKEGGKKELEEVLGMPLNFTDAEYQNAARGQIKLSAEVSIDALLKAFEMIRESNSSLDIMNGFTSVHNILDRDSMKNHPQIELFKKAMEQLAEEKNYHLDTKKENQEI